jgi:hypothetical protein
MMTKNGIVKALADNTIEAEQLGKTERQPRQTIGTAKDCLTPGIISLREAAPWRNLTYDV